MGRGFLLALALLAGCHSTNPAFDRNVGAGAVSFDAAVPAQSEPLAPQVDMSPTPMDAAVDLTTPADLATAADLPTVADLATAADLPTPPDAAIDLSINPAPPNPTPPTGPDLLTGLIGYWPMDDGAGDTAADRSTKGHDGKLEDLDLAGAWVMGHFGGALYVNQNANAGVNVGPSTELDGLQQFTLAAWVYREQVPRFGSILSREIPGTNADVFGLTFSNDLLSIYLPSTPGMTTTLRSSIPFPVRQWVHAAATYDGQTLRVYQAGVSRDSLSVRVTLPPSTAPIYIGTNKNAGQAAEPLGGRLDEVVIYNRALLPSEIAALAGGTRPPVPN